MIEPTFTDFSPAVFTVERMMNQSCSLSQRALDQVDRPVNIAWMSRIFAARAAQNGGVVRRRVKDVHREVGRAAFVAEVQKRGFHLIVCGDQYVVICHDGHLRVIC